MIETIASILAVSAIAAGLAALLVLAARFLADYGECEIRINDEKTLPVQGGSSLLEALTRNQIFIPSACGGRGTCAYCKVKVTSGGGPVLPTEEIYLEPAEREAGVRLSCQVKIRADLSVEIPAALFRVQEYTATCERIRELTHDIREYRFRLLDPSAMDYVPGQYVQLRTPVYADNEEVYRAYSLSMDPAETGVVELVIRLVPGGICTTWCFEYLQEGDRVYLNGPYGDFRLTDGDSPILFVAGGSGMAPIKCMLHYLQNSGSKRSVRFLFGANRVNELFYAERMAEFTRELADFTYVPVVANPEPGADWEGETGLVTAALQRQVPDASSLEAYLCGSPGMIDAAVEVLAGNGLAPDRIFYDKFA